MSDFADFLRIREEYARRLPEWTEQYEKTGDMRQDPYFMGWIFTPIEQSVWSDIRSQGLPFFPQIPVLNYFIDFANPFLKIGIECDGKAWHDHERDRVRDARLAKAGWMIFRIEGHECKRVIEPFEMDELDERDPELLERYFMTTSEGVMHAIRKKYFEDGESLDSWLIDATLFEHRSTPETYPKRRPYARNASGPIRLSDALEDYCAQLLDRMQTENA